MTMHERSELGASVWERVCSPKRRSHRQVYGLICHICEQARARRSSSGTWTCG